MFWEDKLDYVKLSLTNVKLYYITYGNIGTYYNVLEGISKEGIRFSKLVNLDLTRKEIKEAYDKAGYEEETRVGLITEWTYLCLQELKG